MKEIPPLNSAPNVDNKDDKKKKKSFILRKKADKEKTESNTRQEIEKDPFYYTKMWKEKYEGGDSNEKSWERAYSREDGKKFEVEVLGVPDVETIQEQVIEEGLVKEMHFGDTGESAYFVRSMPGARRDFVDPGARKRCFEIVKDNQLPGYDPEDPGLEFPRELRMSIMDKLSIPIEESERVKYYSSLHTTLDHTPQINADAFVEIDGQDYTLDVALYDKYGDIQEGNKDQLVPTAADVFIAQEDISMLYELTTLGKETKFIKKESLSNYDREKADIASKAFVEQVEYTAEQFVRSHNRSVGGG